jgi:hypothetical protein
MLEAYRPFFAGNRRPLDVVGFFQDVAASVRGRGPVTS